MERFWLYFLSSLVKGLFLEDFIGKFVLEWILSNQVYQESTITFFELLIFNLLHFKSSKSCFFQLEKLVQIISLVFLLTITWVFNVCLFFFQE